MFDAIFFVVFILHLNTKRRSGQLGPFLKCLRVSVETLWLVPDLAGFYMSGATVPSKTGIFPVKY